MSSPIPSDISPIPMNGYWALLTKSEYETIVNEKTKAIQERDAANQAMLTASAQVKTLTEERGEAVRTIYGLNEQLRTLTARLEEASKPPPATAPRGRILGFTIENGKTAPDARQYSNVRKAMDWGQRMGLTVYRMFLNPTEMRNHAKPPKGYLLGNLIEYGDSRNLRYMADTMDRIAQLLPNDDDLKAYCDAAIGLGCEGFYINDGDRKELPLVDLMTTLLRLRKAAPGVPIYISLMGNANLALYGKLVDRLEIQTFGSDDELDDYLQIKAIPCLDLRRPLTATDLRKKAAIIGANPPRDFFFYADLASDYDAMPDEEDGIIRDLITKLKSAA